MNKADLNTLEDWWNEGFDGFFAGASLITADSIEGLEGCKWIEGYITAQCYQKSIADRIASPRDTEISDLKELIRE